MSAPPAILLVDRNARNVELLCSFLSEAGYATQGVSSLEELDALLEREPAFDLAFVDLSGFDAAVWERCRRLHEAGIAFVVIARRQVAELHSDLRRRTSGVGAIHTLHKPLRKEQLLTLVRILTGTDD